MARGGRQDSLRAFRIFLFKFVPKHCLPRGLYLSKVGPKQSYSWSGGQTGNFDEINMRCSDAFCVMVRGRPVGFR